MQGIQIFTHSVRQVFGNLGPALRISGLLTLVQFAMIFVLGVQVIFSPDGGRAMMLAGTYPTGRVAIYVLLSMIIGLWIAVAWHRYVLREEDSGGLIPKWHGDRIWAYFTKSFLSGLAIGVAAVVVGLVIGLIVAVLFHDAAATRGNVATVSIVTVLLTVVPIIYIFFRLCPALPAAALGEPLGLRDAWRLMAGKGGTIFVLALVSVIVGIVFSRGPAYLLGLEGLPALMWDGVVQWLNTIIGISIMTTLYGHYVEGRPLV